MITGEVPKSKLQKDIFDASLILYAEHGFNASTFSARVTASTLLDYHSAICSAIGTLKGSLHGGANEQVLYMLKEIQEPENTEKWLEQKLKNKEKIMGFGHRLYRSDDSRVPFIQSLGKKLAKQLQQTRWHDISDCLEKLIGDKKGLFPNLDFPSAPAYYLLNIPIELYTPIFVASRLTGWSAHLIEQYSSNRLIRPSCHYNGYKARPVLPLGDR